MIQRTLFSSLAFLFSLPNYAFALTAEDKAAIARADAAASDFLIRIEENLVFPLVSLLFAIAFLFFLFGVFEYIKGSANEAARTQGQRHILYGLIGMFVMLTAVAILTVARGTFGV